LALFTAAWRENRGNTAMIRRVVEPLAADFSRFRRRAKAP